MHINWYYIPLPLGIALLVFGLYRLKRYIRLHKHGICAEGSVYDIITKQVDHEHHDYFMVIGFLTENQQLIIEEINITFNPYAYKRATR